jgi:hypothetical protein
MIMRSLFLLILLIPWRLLKLIPPSYPQTHLLSLAFIYPPVTHQLYPFRLDLKSPCTLYQPLPLYQKEVQARRQKGSPSYWRTTREVSHRAQNHQQSTQQLTGTQPQLPPFIPTNCYTLKRQDQLNKNHPGSFLWPAERDLMHNFMLCHDSGFAWSEEEQGSFRTDFFPPVNFPVIPHTPWVECNFPVYTKMYVPLFRKSSLLASMSRQTHLIDLGGVLKKDGKGLCPVHSLKPLNRITIQHSGIPHP